MKKLTLALMLVATITASAFAQSPDAKAKADEILKKARAAIGSESKFKSVQALSAEGMINQNQGDRRIESTLELDMLMPDKVKVSQTMQFGTIIRGFDGTNMWNDFVAGVGMGGGPGGGFRGFGGGGPGGPGGQGANNSPMAAYTQQQSRREMVQILLAWFLAAPASSGMQYAYVGEAPGPEGSKLDVVDAKTSDGLSTRLYFNKESYRLVGLSYKAKNLRRAFTGGRGPGGPGGEGGQGGTRPAQAQGAQGQPQGQAQGGGQRQAQGGGQGQGQGAGQAQGAGQGQQRPQMTQEERDRRAKEMAEAFEKALEVDYRWAFDDYKSVGGLNLPHRLTKIEGGAPTEEWEISKYKVNPKLTADKFEKKEKEKAAN
ncbi:MAG: hypothetical protein M3X11_06495 [Acidobacteriota bacterium]|nr:hypothetical protein [Acidobacteriota bacterium]